MYSDPLLPSTLLAVEPLDEQSMQDARDRQAQLTKPAGALGALEDVSITMCGIQRTCPPRPLARPVVAVFAADHGVHAQGVTPWPQEVTASMIENFRAGGAAVNVLARQFGAEVYVVDMGVNATVDADEHVLDHKIRRGTSDLAAGPAMTREEAAEAVLRGAEVGRRLIGAGHDCLLTGDMGIANTTASAALIAALTGAEAGDVTGRGTGIDDQTLAHKTSVVQAGLDRPRDVDDPLAVLASLGGFEHAGLVGFVLAAAGAGVPVVLDGMIAGASALVVQAMAPGAIDYCFAGHRSAEPGHRIALEKLGLRPLVDLELRLGEGTGAVLAFPMVEAAGAILREMATFDSAGVARK